MEGKAFYLTIYNKADGNLYQEKINKSTQKGDTVTQLLQILNDKFRAWAGELIGADGERLQPEWTMSYIRKLGSFVYNPAIASTEAWNKYKQSNQREKVKILVKEATGDLNELEVYQITSGLEIYESIKNAMQIEHEYEFKLSIKKEGEIEILKEYLLENGDIFHVSRNQSGGGSCVKNFVDVTNAAGIKKISFKKNARRWRRAHNGLCIEGKCTNQKCEAHNQMVIISKGFNSYDILLDEYKNLCPLCFRYVQAEKIGFNNCIYSFKGIKFKGNGKSPEKVSQPNTVVGNYYEVFEPQTAGEVDWIQLAFKTYRPIKKVQLCSICLSSQGSLEEFKGKLYHEKCKMKELKLQSQQSTSQESKGDYSINDEY